MVHICRVIISPGVFFIFSKFWFSWLLVGLKWQTMVENDKKLCLSHSISEEPYIIWLSFMVHMCKMVISPGVFFHFHKIFIFQIVRGVKGQNLVQNNKKFSVTLQISGTIHHMNVIYGTHMWNNNISRYFFHFWKNFFPWVVRGLKGQKTAQNEKKLCQLRFISQEPYII